MTRPTSRLAALSVAAAVLFATTGCEDTPVTAGEGWTIDVIAEPPSVPDEGEAQVEITALVANDVGIPQSGVTVVFSTEGGGVLASGASGVETDESGRAVDTLTFREEDPESIEVTAASGLASGSVTVTRNIPDPNLPPVPEISITPATEQEVNDSVLFDGSGTTDPDAGDLITMYRWRFTSTNPDNPAQNPRVVEGPGASTVNVAFANVQTLQVELAVTDDPSAPTNFALGRAVTYRATTTAPYRIVAVRCAANQAPVATIAGPATQTLTGNGQTSVQLELDGSPSSDAETAIGLYTFTCGNGVAPQPISGDGSAVRCTYAVGTAPANFTATLVVRDNGNGFGECFKSSTTPDTVQVTVEP